MLAQAPDADGKFNDLLLPAELHTEHWRWKREVLDCRVAVAVPKCEGARRRRWAVTSARERQKTGAV